MTEKTCNRKHCNEVSVGVIPMPAPTKDRKTPGDVEVCEFHFQDAVDRAYFVIGHSETESQANERHERIINAKHQGLVAARLRPNCDGQSGNVSSCAGLI